MNRAVRNMRMLLIAAFAAMMWACASIGRPEGGPRDETPPVFVHSDPAPGSVNFDGKRLTVVFDENVTLDDPSNKIVVSPPQSVPPRISSGGRRVTIELQDTLRADMTYTVDFADAVRDLNESNVLDGFAIDFATGPTIDTLAISGMVFEARTLEPAQGMVVGVYREDTFTDTTLTTLPLERITKTNQLGQFTVRNLAPGSYRIFAINDLNRDFHWDRSEDVAFLDISLTPVAEPAVWTDTVPDSHGLDSLVNVAGTRFLPDNVLLTWFNENYQPRYLLKNERPERRRLELIFSAPADSMPILTVAEGPHAGQSMSRLSITETSAGRDSLNIWLTDSLLLAADTLRIETRYLHTDTLDRMSWRTDTIPFILRGQKKTKTPKKKEGADTIPEPMPTMAFSLTSGTSQELNLPMSFTSETPVATIDSAGIHLERLVDTVWTAVQAPRLMAADSLTRRRFTAPTEWLPATKYRLTVDSAAVTDIYGLHNKALVQEITTKSTEDYSALFFSVAGVPDTVQAVVELLRQDDPIRRVNVVNNYAAIEYLSPGTYYARMFIDTDGDGQWTTGSISENRQPEEIYYYPKKLTLKKNWDIEQVWDIYSTPVDLQKPLDIKKNKPKKRGFDNNLPTEEEEPETDELWDQYNQDPFFRNPAADRPRY